MRRTQLDLELVLHHIYRLETRISKQRLKIARIRELNLPTRSEEEELAALARALEATKIHLGNMTAVEPEVPG